MWFNLRGVEGSGLQHWQLREIVLDGRRPSVPEALLAGGLDTPTSADVACDWGKDVSCLTDCAVLNELLANISAMDATLTMLTGKGAAFKQQLKTPRR